MAQLRLVAECRRRGMAAEAVRTRGRAKTRSVTGRSMYLAQKSSSTAAFKLLKASNSCFKARRRASQLSASISV